MKNNLTIAVEAAISAGKAILKVYEGDFSIEEKEDKSPLTDADKASNEVIMRFLSDTKTPVISEENKQIDYQDRKNWQECWIVDPLDGTKEFIKRNGEFTVNIALAQNNQPRLGVIYVPVTRELYYGDVLHKAAYKALVAASDSAEEVFEKAEKIAPNKTRHDTVKVVGSRSHMNPETKAFVENLKHEGKLVELVSVGSSLKFCWVAEGKADMYPRYAPTMEWDTAAGQAICEAVGLAVTSKETDRPLLYNKKDLRNPMFLCK